MVLPFNVALYSGVSVAALFAAAGADAYAVGGNAPEFVADFAGVLNSGTEYYRSGGSDTTFSSVFTHSGLVAPATMTDSDGVLKWAPHNLVPYSQDHNSWPTKVGVTVTSGQSDPFGGTSADLLTSTDGTNCYVNTASRAGTTYTREKYSVYAKKGTQSWIFLIGQNASWFDLDTGSTGTNNNLSSSIEAVSGAPGWYKCTIEYDPSAVLENNRIEVVSGNGLSAPSGAGDTVFVFGSHAYRSDLGGMVNNPDRGDSYVPTTTSARFLPRRNHYIYNGSSWEKAGILIEPAAATNLIPYSNDFSNAEWSKTNITATNTGDSPLGTGTAWKIASSSASAVLHRLFDSGIATTNGVKYTLSVFAKSAELSYVALSFTNDFIEAWFNLSTGSVGTVEAGAENARIESFGNGWYRCSVTFTADGTTEDIAIYATQADAQIIETLSIGDGIFVAGAQLEEGSTPSSYIPTSGSTVTRAAETLTAAGSSLPANTTGVSVQMQGRMTYADLGTEAQRTFWRWYNGASDFLLCDLDTDGADTGEVNANQADTTGGAGTVAIDAYSPGINVAYNIASRHSNTDINVAVGGTAGTADTTPTALHDASSDTFQVAHNLQGTVGMLRVWGIGLSDTDLESAT